MGQRNPNARKDDRRLNLFEKNSYRGVRSAILDFLLVDIQMQQQSDAITGTVLIHLHPRQSHRSGFDSVILGLIWISVDNEK